MKEKFSLNDHLFNKEKVELLSSQIKAVYAEFENKKFEKSVLEAFPSLLLKQRITHISNKLQEYLPAKYEDALKIILNALPPKLDESRQDDDFGDFIYAPYGEFIQENGCNKQYLKISLSALATVTTRFSMEFAIRDFINLFPSETFEMLKKCSLSCNYHQRRFASEALRPKLPWAKKLSIDYKLPLEVLDNLYLDSTRYVTRSVSNHLNDISKIDALLVINTLKRWQKKDKEFNIEYILNHSLRTLVKEGNKQALELLGFHANPDIKIFNFNLNESVQIGKKLTFSFDIKANTNENLLIDYIVYFQTKNKKLSKKVHKLKKINMKKGETINIEKSHLFKKEMSTRKLYEGEHQIEIQINGEIFVKDKFLLRGCKSI